MNKQTQKELMREQLETASQIIRRRLRLAREGWHLAQPTIIERPTKGKGERK